MNEVMSEGKQQSPNWEKYCNSHGFVKEGFPFREGFPRGGPFGNVDKTFEVIFRDGTRYQSTVDYSRQYMAEGIQWDSPIGHLDQAVIVAWREL